MTEFHLQAPFSPTGDQPRAIAQLITSINEGNQYQTLLGATGTGKSLGHDDPVFVVEKRDLQTQSQVVPIGKLIDTLIEQSKEKVCHHGDTLILDADSTEVEYYAQSFNPETCAVGLYKIRSFIRHSAPSKMYRLQTACGRSATLTGDHNLWVLRDGQLQLIRTAEARVTDYVPLPEKLLADGNLQNLDPLAVLSGKRLFVEAPEAILAYVTNHGSSKLMQVSAECGVNLSTKISRIRCNNRGRGIEISTFIHLLNSTNNLEGYWEPTKGYVGAKSTHNRLLAQQKLTPEFLRLMGYYIAEGNHQRRYITIANRNEIVRQDIEAILSQLGIPFSVRPSSDYQISSTALAELFARLCGKTAKDKHLPDFWTQLPTEVLGQLLQAYFDGDGTVDKSSAVTATTASQKLASDLVYALSCFGIWARIARKWKRATNSQHSGNWYYQVCVSGQADLKRFQQFIGFSITYKQKALAAQLQYTEHSNVDVVPINGEQLRWLRNQLGMSAKLLGESSGISRSAVQFFETGKRRPRRIVLIQLLDTLRFTAMQRKGLTALWWQVWKAMEQLCKLRWTPIATVEEVEYQHPYVYDFCVPGAETFLAGHGGFFVHNTFTIASVINQIKKPTLVLAHNKTLAAQLCNELREFFPNNAVEYFISYYDYYQPEAYIPVTDTYIEKTASINDEIDMLRHSATRSLFERRDVIVVASISCIYGLGIPSEYLKAAIPFQVGMEVNQREILKDLVSVQYGRNDVEMARGRFRVRGDVLEIGPAYEDRIIRVEFFGDEIDAIRYVDPVTGEIIKSVEAVNIYPARHFVTPEERLESACDDIEAELKERKAQLEEAGKLLEAQRIDQRTRYDLEMLREVGYCNGVENYSRYLAGRSAGAPPECLIDYFPKDWLLVIDESHVTVPQIRGMYNGDQARKKVLIEHGFRLPSAADNRPLKAEEFWTKVNQCIFVSATPGNWELEISDSHIAEQIIRPTGVIDPEIIVRPTEGQIDDLLGEIKDRIDRQERVLITTLTKRMAEDLTEYLQDHGIRVRYLHSEINSIQRIEIIQDLRDGKFDVLVGVNLLREGLDLPEVSLVAILDADKEGFLRAERSLIQTIGRAARHIRGQAILYGDKLTDSMSKAISETERRRSIQTAYNQKHGITPKPIVKKSSNAILSFLEVSRRLNATELETVEKNLDDLPLEDIPQLITLLESQMKEAAKQLEFEEAAKLRDRIKQLRDKLVGH